MNIPNERTNLCVCVSASESKNIDWALWLAYLPTRIDVFRYIYVENTFKVDLVWECVCVCWCYFLHYFVCRLCFDHTHLTLAYKIHDIAYIAHFVHCCILLFIRFVGFFFFSTSSKSTRTHTRRWKYYYMYVWWIPTEQSSAEKKNNTQTAKFLYDFIANAYFTRWARKRYVYTREYKCEIHNYRPNETANYTKW